jgi:hypothetical protein
MVVVGLTKPASGFGKGTAMFATAANIELNGLICNEVTKQASVSYVYFYQNCPDI